MDNAEDTDTPDTADGTPSTTSRNVTPLRKKMKRLQKYRQEWGKESMWLEKVQDNACKARCTVCQRTYSVAHGGLFDLKQPASSGGHIRNVRDNKTGGTLDWFVVHHVIPEAVFFLTP